MQSDISRRVRERWRGLTRKSGLVRGRGDDGDRDDGDRDDVVTDGGTARDRGSGRGRVRALLDGEFVRSMPFWLPGLALVGLFVYGAVGWNFVISLADWASLAPSPDYSSLSFDAYTRMLGDDSFLRATFNTVLLLVAFTGASLVLGLFVAILVDQDIRFENTLRTIYLLPMSLSFVVTAIFWSWMYNNRFGAVNVLLEVLESIVNAPLGLVGVQVGLTQDWLGDPRFKLWAVVFALMWQFSGYCMIVYLAALRSIPTEHYEAARVDGASTVRMYARVIIPQLRTATTSAAVVLMVFALKAFDFLFVMFGGTNLGRSVDILSIMMFRVAFDRGDLTYGAAIATVLFLLALGVIAPYLFAQYRRGEL